MDEDELEFGNGKKGNSSKSAKQGRRARGQDDDLEETLGTSEMPPTARPEGTGPPRPSCRVGGWGEEEKSPSGTTGTDRRRAGIEELEDERLRPRSPEDSDDDIPVIPDLDDQQEDEVAAGIAMAPNVAINRVATYRELDNDLLRHAAFVTLDNDIDLKLLTKGLAGEADVLEEDKLWDWDRLFTEVSSELLSEWEQESTEKEEIEKPSAMT